MSYTSLAQDLVRSLQSPVCPFCGGSKKRAQTACRSCYFSLPKDLRFALYDRMGSGYEAAFERARAALGVERLYLPTED
jgi:tRNA(Ile2) C34 agmatinyltransferase TiaS